MGMIVKKSIPKANSCLYSMWTSSFSPYSICMQLTSQKDNWRIGLIWKQFFFNSYVFTFTVITSWNEMSWHVVFWMVLKCSMKNVNLVCCLYLGHPTPFTDPMCYTIYGWSCQVHVSLRLLDTFYFKIVLSVAYFVACVSCSFLIWVCALGW